ncbi:MAG: ATP-dependent helicase [Flavobacterium sp.]|nr:ATP-dependent helicase [Aeromicrobium sp.]
MTAPQSIIAGAGSGKTTVMAARVVWLAGHEKVDPATVLGLTFTNKAAAELGVKVRDSLALVGDWSEQGEPTVSTYHAFAGSLIAEHGLRIGIEPDLRILSDATRFQLLARTISVYDLPLVEVSTHVPTLVKDVMALDGQLSEHLITTEALREFDLAHIVELESGPTLRKMHVDAIATARKRTELSHLVDRYRQAKVEAGVMDFSDQMAWGASIAMVPGVGAALRERFKVVLLDEYQDTSVAQRDLLANLFSGPDPESGRGHSVTAVGDPAQGIYGWRGAAASNLADFLHDFPPAVGPPGEPHSLDVSRRCGADIIDIANEVASPYYATSTVVRPLRAAAENGPGHVDAALHLTVGDEIDAIVHGVLEVHAAGTPWKEIAILVRIGAENGAIVTALRDMEVPVEVVGLNGLLEQPEVRDLLALLEVVEDVTANPSLLRLLTGPRWRIGPRDLALLGRRASTLSGGHHDTGTEVTLEGELERAVAGTDPTEIVSLADALDDLGSLPYSADARHRFGELAGILASVRRHVGEPLHTLARRAMTTLDLDLELQSGSSPSGMDNLGLLFEAIAGYAENDRFASLSGLLAYLGAEEQYNKGMEVSAPSEADSVKLLTAHKSKGLEWDEVFVPFLAKGIFPDAKGRSRWVSVASALPVSLRGDREGLADIDDWTSAGLAAYKQATADEALMEERRLAYVAFTRARHGLHVSGHRWGRTQKKPREESEFLLTVTSWLAVRDRLPLVWAPEPLDDTNPYAALLDVVPWPAPLTGLDRRREVAALVRALRFGADPATPPPADTEAAQADEQAGLDRLGAISTEIDDLLLEAAVAAVNTRVVRLPGTLSATNAMALANDRDAFIRELARPVPRRPSTAARFGTRFHAWVEEHFGQRGLFDPTDLPGSGDRDVVGIESDPELEALKQSFVDGPYGGSSPFAVEAPFSIVLGGQQVIGRIDAVYRTTSADGRHTFEVVDWKTNQQANADPLQLAIYRLAWAELNDLDPAQVTGAFYYVRLGDVKRFGQLPGRAELERRLGLA